MANKKGVLGKTVGKAIDGVLSGADNIIDGIFGSDKETTKKKTTTAKKSSKKKD